jgi:TatA/E family protein of Tat protein translocase
MPPALFTNRLHEQVARKRGSLVMFGSLGFPELILIFIVALIVFGPRRLPEIGRSLGKALGEFKKATEELKTTIEKEVRMDEIRQLHPAELVKSISRTEPVTTIAAVAPPEPAPLPAAQPPGPSDPPTVHED